MPTHYILDENVDVIPCDDEETYTKFKDSDMLITILSKLPSFVHDTFRYCISFNGDSEDDLFRIVVIDLDTGKHYFSSDNFSSLDNILYDMKFINHSLED